MRAQIGLEFQTTTDPEVRAEVFNRLMNVLFAEGPDPVRVARRLMLVATELDLTETPPGVRTASREQIRELMLQRP